MKPSTSDLSAARWLIRSRHAGVLSTHSVEMDGYPFGSVATFCLDSEGHPILMMSDIAQHTKNLEKDNRCSLLIRETEQSDAQASGRMTFIGRMEPIEETEEIRNRFFSYFPEAAQYSQFHDFSFFRLVVERYRYIGGFGKIFWLDPGIEGLANPLDAKTEAFVIDHMNDHHQHNLRTYLQNESGIPVDEDSPISLCGMDAEGIDILYDGRIHRVKLSRTISTAKEAREVLTDMARAESMG